MAYERKIDSARYKCFAIVKTEKLMGYDESAESYRELADELLATYHWLNENLPYTE
jgi:hypothetical protein